MATSYPNSFQQFSTMQDITSNDAPIVEQYQDALLSGDYTRAQQLLQMIPDYSSKMITADLLNTLFDTNVEVQKFYTKRYSPAYVVSSTKPLAQEIGDFWIVIEN